MPHVLLIVPGLLLAWVIGANDAANSMGTAVGSGVRTPRQGVVLAAVFGLAGAMLMGGRVEKTLGEGILPLPVLPAVFAQLIAFSALAAAGLTVLICTGLRLPVSTSHAVTGGLVGGALSAGVKSLIVWGETARIFCAWVLTPVAACLLAMVFCRLGRYLPAKNEFFSFSGRAGKMFVTITGCYMAFCWGANDVANATGVLSGILPFPPFLVTLAGGMMMVCGVLMWGERVMPTIGEKITRLNPATALTAEFTAAVVVHIFTLGGLPVSTTHAVVGAVGGIGMSRGRNAVTLPLLAGIVLTWAVTPFFAGSLAFFLHRLLQLAVVMTG